MVGNNYNWGPNSLSVLQWNVWYRAKAQHTADHILRIVEQQGPPDILCLQELTEPAVELVANAIGARDLSYVVTRTHKNGIVEGQAIVSRALFANFAGVEVVLLSHGGRAPFKGSDHSNRVLQKTRVLAPSGQMITVANAHTSYKTPTNSVLRSEELATLQGAIANERRLILTGDFNTSQRSPTVRQIGSLLIRADQDEPTWSSSHIDRIGLLRRNLDHVFTTPDLEVIDLTVLDRGPSDHSPILVIVEPI